MVVAIADVKSIITQYDSVVDKANKTIIIMYETTIWFSSFRIPLVALIIDPTGPFKASPGPSTWSIIQLITKCTEARTVAEERIQ